MVKFRKGSLCIILTSLIALASCSNEPADQASLADLEISDVVDTLEELSTVETIAPEPDAKMSDYLRYAVNSSPEVAALRAEERIAQSRIDAALSKTRPQVSASSAVGGYKANVKSGDVDRGTSVSLTVSQLLFDGGMTSSSISEAELELALAEASTQSAVNRISAEAAKAGLAVFLASNNLKSIRKFQEGLKPQVAQLKLMAQSGLVDRSMLDEVKGRLLELDIAEQEARTAENIANLGFSKYFRDLEAPGSEFVLPETMQASLSSKLSVEFAPNVREAALRVMIAEQRLEHARSAFSPKINAQAGSSSPMDPDEHMNAQLGIMLTYQIGDGGARQSNLIGAKASFEQTKRSAQFQIENSKNTLNSLSEKLKNTDILLKLAKKKLPMLVDQLSVAERQIQTGQADVVKVFNIKLQVNEIESRIRQEQADLTKTKIEMAALLGLFSQ